MSYKWSPAYTCNNSSKYCKSWKKDMHRCCPKTCKVVPFTENVCRALNASDGQGQCVYPFPAEDDDCYVKGNMPYKQFQIFEYVWDHQQRCIA